jgi:SAM-dependent methyltransferase
MIDVDPRWWQTFFSGVFLDYWELVSSPEQDRADADFLAKVLGVAPSAKLLDVPCGNGRLVVELAARGYRMTGVDIADYITKGKERAAERGLDVRLEQRDMRDLPWTEEFDGAFSFLSSVGYFDDEGNAAFLRAVARALKPGAVFVIDYGYVAESLLPDFRDSRARRVGEYRSMLQSEYDFKTGRFNCENTIICGTHMETRRYSARVYTYRELVALLTDAGFDEFNGFSSLAGEPFRLGAPRLLLTARKRAR